MSDDLLRTVTERLTQAGVPSAYADGLALVAHVWGRSPSDARRDLVLGRRPDEQQLVALAELVDERTRRVPLQHLTGRAPFRHLELSVGPGVFIPRPETELLVDLVLAAAGEQATVTDLCTGSGAIALAIKQERPDLQVAAIEVDELAFAWAQRNAQTLGLDVNLSLGDARTAFPALLGEVDVVVSNPPYIPVGMEPIDPEVRDHDPQVALYGGSADGLRIPLAVAARAADLLRDGGVLIMEHADSQGDSLPAALRADGRWRDVTDEVDLTGRPRAVRAVRVDR
ncbi:peptide chain release factor N(5)-glutamine methyltransferase [Branchiibius sp. NY16-3462-2]|uniref:peptide chain release factor N(5)-glutamine methyltransferase n=1 Tax=Branchiibius sp. NY16-3462-2 TaxID=1807500 RepID=UPI0007985631|nr:peptide chain release factor N(5)-glutamine methyltransferase [Branchiibius sp. NY16-3462-2]KYH45830.1 protein-(glutamine-N5) methyltransferase, release factor-specific [Branchiibius sp. NY16-3462-2]